MLAKNILQCADWVSNFSEYATVSDQDLTPYPEVTGYFIPTLKEIGAHKQAQKFANYLATNQNTDGSWSFKNTKYLFDTAQAIHGLSYYGKEYKVQIQRGLDYIVPKLIKRQLDKYKKVPDHIYPRLLYAISTTGYDVSGLIKNYCTKKMVTFDCISHFWAYAFEGFAKLGLNCDDFVKTVVQYDCKIPESSINNTTYCLTGLSQTAVSLFEINEFELGLKTFGFVSSMQSANGGFLGSNGGKYFPNAHISWAAKFYLDACLQGIKTQCNLMKESFKDFFEFGNNDPRLNFMRDRIEDEYKVLDVGCGKGRYINRLPCDRYACDLYDASKYLVDTNFKLGSVTNLPYEDNFFDVVICCEALDLTPFIHNALNEMNRVLKKGGKLLLIEKIGEKPTKSMFAENWLTEQFLQNKYNAKITRFTLDLPIQFIGVEIIKK